MKNFLVTFALGAIAGACGYKKMTESKLPKKVIKCAKKKLDD